MKTILTLVSLLAVGLIQAQQRCVSMHESQKEMQADSAYAQGVFELEEMAASLASGGDTTNQRDALPFPTITVPIVVHVLYRTEEQNISMEQIHSQIDVLNRDFAGLNADLDKVPEPFRALAGSTKIRFQLADQDPDGRFTNGVTRTQTTVENIGSQAIYHRPERGGIAPWPRPHYLNVWICELEGNALGFAILPSAQMSERDGIVMSHTAFGTSGTVRAPYDHGRTFVHEVGHYFGLRHLWGSDDASCTSTDYVNDTPVQLKENFGCKDFPSFSCNNEDFGDMFMNYMDYGNDTCMLFFTQQQVALMHLVLMTNRKTLFHSMGATGQVVMQPERNLHLFPNPARETIHLESNGRPLGLVIVRNLDGMELYRVYENKSRLTLDLTAWSSGMYFVQTQQGVRPMSVMK